MLKKIANTIGSLTLDAVENAGSRHPGLPMGCAELGDKCPKFLKQSWKTLSNFSKNTLIN